VDKTAPVVTFAGNAATYTADQTVAFTCTAADTLSGIASASCSNINKPAYSFPLGVNTVAATATDKAGNITKANVTFTVKSTPTAFLNVLVQFVSQSNPQAANIMQKYSAQITQLVNAIAASNPKVKTAVINLIVTAIKADTGTVFTQSQATTLINLVKAL
jgi:HYR domain